MDYQQLIQSILANADDLTKTYAITQLFFCAGALLLPAGVIRKNTELRTLALSVIFSSLVVFTLNWLSDKNDTPIKDSYLALLSSIDMPEELFNELQRIAEKDKSITYKQLRKAYTDYQESLKKTIPLENQDAGLNLLLSKNKKAASQN